jgi:hypothetical protein
MSAHRVTIKEATRLTGRSRRSLYRDMATGHLSYHAGNNGRRLVDVSELIRAYGALEGLPEQVEAKSTLPAAGSRTDELLAELLEVTRQQSLTLEQQYEELAALRREVAELRTLPAPGALAHHERLASDQTPVADDRSYKAPAVSEAQHEPPRDIGDVLKRFENRSKA